MNWIKITPETELPLSIEVLGINSIGSKLIGKFREHNDYGLVIWNRFQLLPNPTHYCIITNPEDAEKTNQYEYELFFKSEETDKIKIDGWYPIATDSIKDQSKIEQYIENGLLRRITNPEE